MTEPVVEVADVPAATPRRRVLLPLLVAAVVFAGLWLAFKRPPDLVQGMVDADSVHVAAKIAARVSSLAVREGDAVSAGQVLFELDSPEVRARLEQAQAAVAAAEAAVSKAEEGARSEEIAAARANWERMRAADELAQATWKRVQSLHKQGVMTAQKRDEASAQARGAAQATAAARAQYEQALAGARVQDKDAAQAQARQALALLAEVQAASDETRGIAPSDGEVDKKLANLGELVPAGFPVFTLVDIAHPWVAFHLREDQFAGVRIGQRLQGEVPALQLKQARFEVYFIDPAGDFATWRATRQSSGYDVRSFEVRVRPVQPIAGFRPGMSVLFPWPQE